MTLAHDSTGSGPPVLLLHSSVCDRRMWDPQWPVLAAAGFQLVRADFRGFGETPPARSPYRDADDIRDLLDALGIGTVALIGSSYGGAVALEVAARWPERVRAMALLCAAMPGHQPSPRLREFGEREDALLAAGDLAAAVALNLDTWLGPDAGPATREAVRRMQRHAFEVQLAVPDEPEPVEVAIDLSAIRAACLAVSGRHDLPDFRQIAARLPGLVPGARHVELPWAGHLPSLERPAETTTVLATFLRGSPG
jgi:pimeloyl-ACP methyl ester carboxylesterase